MDKRIVILHVDYMSCEGNVRWTELETDEDWGESDIRDRLLGQGSCGDDPSEIIGMYEIYKYND